MAPSIFDAMASHPTSGSAKKWDDYVGGGDVEDDRPARGASDDLEEMKDEFDLYALICRDVGNQGYKSGERIGFNPCPICGHDDDFFFYPGTKKWSCYSASNTTGHENGTCIDYFMARYGDDLPGAINRLREETGHPRKTSKAPEEESDGEQEEYLLPCWRPARASNPKPLKPEFIPGMLRLEGVALLVGKGKTGKSFLMLELCAAAAMGCPWLGNTVRRGRSLFINPEIDEAEMDDRVFKICKALNIDRVEFDRYVEVWDLRGIPATVDDLVHDIELAGEKFVLVVVDSASAFFRGNENDAVDVRTFMSKFNPIGRETGASVFTVHHEAKVAPGQRQASDRARGSSAWRDCCDLFLTLDEITGGEKLPGNQTALALEVEAIRSFPGIDDPIRMLWDYPLHKLDVEDITEGFSVVGSKDNPSAKRGKERAKKCEHALLVEFLKRGDGCEEIPAGEACEVCGEALGENVATTKLREYIEEAGVFQIRQAGNSSRWYIVRPASEGGEGEEEG